MQLADGLIWDIQKYFHPRGLNSELLLKFVSKKRFRVCMHPEGGHRSEITSVRIFMIFVIVDKVLVLPRGESIC